MMPIIRWELKQRKFYTLWWSVGLILTIALLMLIYPSIRDQAKQLDAVISQLPESIRSFRGVGSDFASPIGYLNSEVYYATLPLLMSILTIGLGSSLLARDEQAHTLELLLARPVSRRAVIGAKAISGLTVVLIVGLVTAITTIALAKVVDMDISIWHILLASLYCMALSIAFGMIAFALTATGSATRRASIATATFVAFGGYILTSLANSSDWIKTPATFLPYHYYAPEVILQGKISLGLSVYLLTIILVAAAVSIVCFQRRDIRLVTYLIINVLC
jgi:ABC-2 type transport system permease protein